MMQLAAGGWAAALLQNKASSARLSSANMLPPPGEHHCPAAFHKCRWRPLCRHSMSAQHNGAGGPSAATQVTSPLDITCGVRASVGRAWPSFMSSTLIAGVTAGGQAGGQGMVT